VLQKGIERKGKNPDLSYLMSHVGIIPLPVFNRPPIFEILGINKPSLQVYWDECDGSRATKQPT
jgi:hypothetical protein